MNTYLERIDEERTELKRQLAEARAANIRLQEALASDPTDQSEELERLRRELDEARLAQRYVSTALSTCVGQLAEARAALAEIDQHLTDLVLGERGWWGWWRDVHAAALKAARDNKRWTTISGG